MIALARRWGARSNEALGSDNLMYVLTMAGRFDEAYRIGIDVLQSSSEDTMEAPWLHLRLAHVDALRGQPEAARRRLMRCQALSSSDEVQSRAAYAACESAVALAEGQAGVALEAAFAPSAKRVAGDCRRRTSPFALLSRAPLTPYWPSLISRKAIACSVNSPAGRLAAVRRSSGHRSAVPRLAPRRTRHGGGRRAGLHGSRDRSLSDLGYPSGVPECSSTSPSGWSPRAASTRRRIRPRSRGHLRSARRRSPDDPCQGADPAGSTGGRRAERGSHLIAQSPSSRRRRITYSSSSRRMASSIGGCS